MLSGAIKLDGFRSCRLLCKLNLEAVEALTLCQPQCMHDEARLYNLQACLRRLPHRTDCASVCHSVGPIVTDCQQAAAHTVHLYRPLQICQDWPLLRPSPNPVRLASPCCAIECCTDKACICAFYITLHACKLETVRHPQEADI